MFVGWGAVVLLFELVGVFALGAVVAGAVLWVGLLEVVLFVIMDVLSDVFGEVCSCGWVWVGLVGPYGVLGWG